MERRLVGSYFGMHRFDGARRRAVEFDLPYGEWIRLFRCERLSGRGAARDPAPGGSRVDLPDGGGDGVGALLADGGDLAMRVQK